VGFRGNIRQTPYLFVNNILLHASASIDGARLHPSGKKLTKAAFHINWEKFLPGKAPSYTKTGNGIFFEKVG
jgi:hypothetical protein